MKKTCESAKRFEKEEWQTAERKLRTLQPIKPNSQDADKARLVSGYVWR